MTILRLRQEAHNLMDLAEQSRYDAGISLDHAWHRLTELFRQVRYILGSKASGFTLEGTTRTWQEVSNQAKHVIRACDCDPSEALPSYDIPGDYGA
jgi:hypothetical protein